MTELSDTEWFELHEALRAVDHLQGSKEAWLYAKEVIPKTDLDNICRSEGKRLRLHRLSNVSARDLAKTPAHAVLVAYVRRLFREHGWIDHGYKRPHE